MSPRERSRLSRLGGPGDDIPRGSPPPPRVHLKNSKHQPRKKAQPTREPKNPKSTTKPPAPENQKQAAGRKTTRGPTQPDPEPRKPKKKRSRGRQGVAAGQSPPRGDQAALGSPKGSPGSRPRAPESTRWAAGPAPQKETPRSKKTAYRRPSWKTLPERVQSERPLSCALRRSPFMMLMTSSGMPLGHASLHSPKLVQ